MNRLRPLRHVVRLTLLLLTFSSLGACCCWGDFGRAWYPCRPHHSHCR